MKETKAARVRTKKSNADAKGSLEKKSSNTNSFGWTVGQLTKTFELRKLPKKTENRALSRCQNRVGAREVCKRYGTFKAGYYVDQVCTIKTTPHQLKRALREWERIL